MDFIVFTKKRTGETDRLGTNICKCLNNGRFRKETDPKNQPLQNYLPDHYWACSRVVHALQGI